MAITKRTEFGSRNILADGQIQVRIDTVIEEDGVELSRTYHRHVLVPGDDLSQEPANMANVAKAVWTPEVVTVYKVKLAESRL